MQLSSIQQFENRAAARVKWLVNPSLPKVFYGNKELPDAAYVEDLTVYDCTKLVMAVADSTNREICFFTLNGQTLNI